MVTAIALWLEPQRAFLSRWRLGRWVWWLLGKMSQEQGADGVRPAPAYEESRALSVAVMVAASEPRTCGDSRFKIKLLAAGSRAADLIESVEPQAAQQIRQTVLPIIAALPVEPVKRAMYDAMPREDDLGHFAPLTPYRAIFDRVITLYREQLPETGPYPEWGQLWWQLATRTGMVRSRRE